MILTAAPKQGVPKAFLCRSSSVSALRKAKQNRCNVPPQVPREAADLPHPVHLSHSPAWLVGIYISRTFTEGSLTKSIKITHAHTIHFHLKVFILQINLHTCETTHVPSSSLFHCNIDQKNPTDPQ